MSNEIIIKQSGFVTGDALLNPIAYAGEMNSRVINIIHPTFDNCYYQLLVIKDNYPYTLGIDNGKVILPPSLTSVTTNLNCQFVAIRKNENIDITSNNCDCYPTSSNDCSNMIFKSDKFILKVAEGLSLNGLTPIPPYEQLVDMYNNMSKAKLAVEKAKAENLQIANIIDEKIRELQRLGYNLDLEKEIKNRTIADNELQQTKADISYVNDAIKKAINGDVDEDDEIIKI